MSKLEMLYQEYGKLAIFQELNQVQMNNVHNQIIQIMQNPQPAVDESQPVAAELPAEVVKQAEAE